MTRLPVVLPSTLALVFALAFAALPAHAGGGPETTLVVVNADSPTSLAVANEYVRLRDIPASHVLHLEHVPAAAVIPIDAFRERILQPIEDYLRSRGLADDVDTIAYSTGFPYAVNFSADLKAKDVKPGRLVRAPHASLTGLTYLYRRVLAQDPAGYLGMQVNGYFRKPASVSGAGGSGRGPNAEEQRLAQDAQGAMRSKDWRRAADALTKLTASYPFDPHAWYNLACCLAVLDENDRALDALEKAVEHGFRDADHAAADVDLAGLREAAAFERLLEAMRNAGGGGVQPSHGFTARQAWRGADAPEEPADESDLDRYRLAVMLGWTGPYGNSRDEVLACLRSAAASDGTRPDGTVYLMVNRDKNRIGPRQPFYQGTIDALKRLGRKTEVLEQDKDGQDGVLPKQRDDVLGLVTGKATFKWGKEMPPLLPGSIADHLTSFGAHFGNAGQTKCTEFIRHGAAGTSGTVAEPFNHFVKFPVPFLHVHYARGCSLAEAHYQSIWMPYQLLLLGDPLARPFARFAEISLAGIPDAPLTGTVTLPVKVDAPTGRSVAELELWVDGVRTARVPAGSELTWDTTQVADGWHEIRVVAVDGDSIQTRSYASSEVEVGNAEHTLQVSPPEASVAPGEVLKLKGKVEGPLTEVDLLRGHGVLASAPVKGKTWRLEVPASRLGEGTTRMRVAARTADGRAVLSKSFEVTVEGGATRRLPNVVGGTELLPGVRAVLADKEGSEHPAILGSLAQGPGRTLRHDLADRGVPTPHSIRAEGFLEVPSAGTWEIEVRASGPVRLSIGEDEVVRLEAAPPNGRVFASVPLELGHHPIALEASGPLANRVGLYLSGPRASVPLTGTHLTHLPPEAKRATLPLQVVEAGTETARPGLWGDDQRGGKGVPVPVDGFEVHWKRTERNVVGVALFPPRGKGAPAFPSDWIVEIRSSTRGKWREVKNLEMLFCPPPEAPRKDASHPLTMVYLTFDKTSARQLRVRPAPGAGEGVRLSEIIVYGRAKRR